MLPDTSENFYEYAWQVRAVIIDDIISSCGNSQKTVLDQFSLFEGRHHIGLQRAAGQVEETGEEFTVLTGQANIRQITDVSNKELEKQIQNVYKRMIFLTQFLENDVEAVVELGCGYGLNLFRLQEILGDRPLKYFGAEYTKSGRQLCTKLAGLDGGKPVQVDFIDHKSPNLDFLDGIGKALIFTCHSIEQVGHIPEDFFSILASAADTVRGIHFEPFGFQVPGFAHKFPQQKETFEEKGWNRNFYQALHEACQKGVIQIKHIELEKFFIQPNNPTSVAVWDNY